MQSAKHQSLSSQWWSVFVFAALRQPVVFELLLNSLEMYPSFSLLETRYRIKILFKPLQVLHFQSFSFLERLWYWEWNNDSCWNHSLYPYNDWIETHVCFFGAGEERLDLNPSLNLNGHVRSDADGKEVMRWKFHPILALNTWSNWGNLLCWTRNRKDLCTFERLEMMYNSYRTQVWSKSCLVRLSLSTRMSQKKRFCWILQCLLRVRVSTWSRLCNLRDGLL